jgi:hypothetical protein
MALTMLRWCLHACNIPGTQKKTYKGYLKPKGVRRVGDDWHVVSENYAKLIIALNRSSTCDEVKTMVQNFRDKLSRDEVIYVPYNHSLLRLDHTKMVCRGQQVNRSRREFYALVGSITRKKLDDGRKLFGCKQLCTIVT